MQENQTTSNTGTRTDESLRNEKKEKEKEKEKETIKIKKIQLRLTFSDHTGANENGADEDDAMEKTATSAATDTAPDISEFVTEGEFVDGARREIRYCESAELGMGNNPVRISWQKDEPLVICIFRGGDMETTMTFEPGRRHILAYNMPGMAFELCTHTLRAENTFDGTCGGELFLDYVVEVRGGFAGRRKMCATVLPLPENPGATAGLQ